MSDISNEDLKWLFSCFYKEKRSQGKVWEQISISFRKENPIRSLMPPQLTKIFDTMLRLNYETEFSNIFNYNKIVDKAIPYDMEQNKWVDEDQFNNEVKAYQKYLDDQEANKPKTKRELEKEERQQKKMELLKSLELKKLEESKNPEFIKDLEQKREARIKEIESQLDQLNLEEQEKTLKQKGENLNKDSLKQQSLFGFMSSSKLGDNSAMKSVKKVEIFSERPVNPTDDCGEQLKRDKPGSEFEGIYASDDEFDEDRQIKKVVSNIN